MRFLKTVLSTSNKIIKPFTIVIEGNIACGKTTFLEHFKKYEDVKVLTEPVEMWRSCRGHNLLNLMYDDTRTWAFPFQMYALLTMLQRHNEITDKPVRLMERSVYSAQHCFVEKMTKDGILLPPHKAILDEYFKLLSASTRDIDLIVYLRCKPEVAYNRMMLRGRKEEQLVPFEYIQDLHTYHENWLHHKTAFPTPAPVITLDAELELSKIDNEYRKFQDHVMKTVNA